MCWELNLGLLEKQQALLTFKPSLQPIKYILLNEMDMYAFFFQKHETFILDLEMIKLVTGGLRERG